MEDAQIIYFLETAKDLNFTAAARRCFISQPSLSRNIALLEQELGVKLFKRDNRNVQLTKAGEYIRQEFELLIAQKEQMVRQARFLSDERHGSLRVGIQDNLWSVPAIAKLLPAFLKEQPNIEGMFSVHSYETMYQMLQSNGLDVIFCKQFIDYQLRNYSVLRIMECTPALVVNRENPLSRAESVTMADLKDEKFIVLEQSVNRFAYSSLIDTCRKEGFLPNVSWFVNTNAARIMYVNMNLGVTLMDMETVLPSTMDALVKVPIVSGGLEPVGIYAVSLKYPGNPLVQSVFDFLKSRLELC